MMSFKFFSILTLRLVEPIYEELDKYCHEELTGYKRPRHFEFVDELPKSNVGKIIRRELREREEAKAG